MKKLTLKSCLVICLLSAVMVAGNLHAQSINVPTLEVHKGATANLHLSFNAGGGTTNFDFTMTYNPAIIDEGSISFLCDKDIVGLTALDCTHDDVNNQIKGIGTNLAETALGTGEFAVFDLPVKDTAAYDSYVDPFEGHFADAITVAYLDTTWTLNVVPDYCNIKAFGNLTEADATMFEACENLILGPGFTADNGASIMLSSGLDIEIIPEFRVNQGATLNAAVCGQSLCGASGNPMPDGCHSCVVQICGEMPSCCDTEWTQECVNKVATTCNLTCQ